MASSSFFSQNPTALLAEALDSYRDYPTDFLEKVIRGLLEEALKEDPSVVSLPDGRSILIEAAKAPIRDEEEPLWVGWWKARGPEAWLPTSRCPNPLVDFIGLAETPSFRRFSSVPFDALPLPLARRAFLDALAHAMPLSMKQAQAWPTSSPLSEDQLENVQAQATLMEYCIHNTYVDEHLSPSFKIKALISSGGVVPQSAAHSSNGDFIYHYPAGVLIRVLDDSAFGRPKSNPWPQWWEEWLKNGSYHFTSQVLPELKKAGIQTDEIEKRAFITKAMGRVSGLVQKKASIADSWQAFEEVMSSRPDAWLLGDESGVLWHRALKLHPGLVVKAVSDPKIDWSMLDQNGHGIWDHLSDPALRGGLSATTIKKLARVAPLVLAPNSTPLFWHSWSPKQGPAIDVLMEETFAANPKAWLGSKSQQRRGAIDSAVELFSNNDRAYTRAALVLNSLFSPGLDRTLFCQDLLTVMTVLQAVIQKDDWMKTQVPNAIDFPVQSLAPHRQAVADSMKKKLLASDGPSSRQRAAILQATMELSLSGSQPALSRPRF